MKSSVITPRKPKATVVILTKNGMPLVEQCLTRVFEQKTPWEFEVLIIDSGSKDATLEVVQQFSVELIQIPPHTFNHGRTRNLGGENAGGEFLVYLVQDAVPASDGWLATLVAAAEADGIAGSYGRQLSRPDSHILTHRTMEQYYSALDQPFVKRLPDAEIYSSTSPIERFHLATFTNCCSCIRKEVWAKYSFAEIPYGEDIEWAKRVLEAGYAIVYESAATVYHSHDRSAWYELKRAYADHHLVHKLFRLTAITSLTGALRTVGWGIRDSWRYVLFSHHSLSLKARLFLWAPLLICAQVFGQYLGARSDWLKTHLPWFQRFDSLLRKGV